MPRCSRLSASVTVSYELVYVSAHGVPVVVSQEKFEGLSSAWMSEGWGIVVAMQEM